MCKSRLNPAQTLYFKYFLIRTFTPSVARLQTSWCAREPYAKLKENEERVNQLILQTEELVNLISENGPTWLER